jgi:hypothetical protein
MREYDTSVDLGHQMLRLAEEEISRWSPRTRSRSCSLVVANDQVIPPQCEGLVMARLESPLGVENGLVEPSSEALPPLGLYIARTLVRAPGDTREGLECYLFLSEAAGDVPLGTL